MNKRKRMASKALLVFFLVMGSFSCILAEEIKPLNTVLQKDHVQFSMLGSLPVTYDYRFPARGITFHKIIAQDERIHVEIETMQPFSEDDVENHVNLQYEEIISLYGPRIIPYPGAVSKPADCPGDKKPEEISVMIMGSPTRVLLANATDRYALGIWEDSLIKQKTIFFVIYDKKNKMLMKTLIFQSIKDFSKKNAIDILNGIIAMKE